MMELLMVVVDQVIPHQQVHHKVVMVEMVKVELLLVLYLMHKMKLAVGVAVRVLWEHVVLQDVEEMVEQD